MEIVERWFWFNVQVRGVVIILGQNLNWITKVKSKELYANSIHSKNERRMSKAILSIILSIGISPITSLIHAQTNEYDLDYTINYINQRIDQSCKVFSEKKNIRVEYFSNGKTIRIDEFYPEAIDLENSPIYSDTEQALILSCYENAGKCVKREILTHGTKLYYDRINLLAHCEGTECQNLERALRHLMMLYIAEDDYQRTKPFEEE